MEQNANKKARLMPEMVRERAAGNEQRTTHVEQRHGFLEYVSGRVGKTWVVDR